jgi:hypothetical protein
VYVYNRKPEHGAWVITVFFTRGIKWLIIIAVVAVARILMQLNIFVLAKGAQAGAHHVVQPTMMFAFPTLISNALFTKNAIAVMGMFISSLWADFPQNGHGDVMMIGQFTSKHNNNRIIVVWLFFILFAICKCVYIFMLA